VPRDLEEQPRHPSIDLRPFKKELADLALSLMGTEVATEESGYLEGALLAAEDAVTALINL